jgi:hypothetical protein
MTDEVLNMDATYMTEEEIMALGLDDLRDLSPDEELHDNFRRMFQMMGLIYQNQIEIKNRLDANVNAKSELTQKDASFA